MKISIMYCLVFVLFSSCLNFSKNQNTLGFRDGSASGILVNEGSLIGSWEQTHAWNEGDGEFPASWNPVNINYSNNYVFLDDGTFTSTNKIDDCIASNGTYSVDRSKIKLKYSCETQPELIEEVLINEFFFREKHIVFIQGMDFKNISKLELVR